MDYENYKSLFKDAKNKYPSFSDNYNPVAAQNMTDRGRKEYMEMNRKAIFFSRKSHLIRNIKELKLKNNHLIEKKNNSSLGMINSNDSSY